MKIVIISADEEDAVGAKKVQSSLAEKEIEVRLFNLFEYIEEPTSSFTLSNKQARKLAYLINKFKPNSIYICVHGLYQDVKTCYYGQFTTEQSEHMQPLASAHQLGKLLARILPTESKLDIELLMCFGARTAENTRDHIKEIKKLNIFDSFGYRLFMQLAKNNRNISMSAYLTETGCPDGEIQVEHENAFALKQEKDQLAEKRIAIQRNFDQNPGLSEDEAHELGYRDYKLLSAQISLDENRAKLRPKGVYGKINYVFRQDQCRIMFEHQGRDELLYKGPLKLKIPAKYPPPSFVKSHPYLTVGGLGLLFAGTAYTMYALQDDKNDETNFNLTFTLN